MDRPWLDGCHDGRMITMKQEKLREAVRAEAEKRRRRGSHIGENTRCWGYTDIVFPGKVTIGRNCVLATRSAVLTHGVFATLERGKPVMIGDNCYLGYGAIVVPGVIIGDNCVIGAGAVVTSDIPSNSIAVGNPARVIGQRDPEELALYIETRERGD